MEHNQGKNKKNDAEISKIIITDENNQQLEGEIIFSFEENGDQYIIYELNGQAFGAKVDDNNRLSPINDDEWTLVEKIYYQFLEDNDKDEDDYEDKDEDDHEDKDKDKDKDKDEDNDKDEDDHDDQGN